MNNQLILWLLDLDLITKHDLHDDSSVSYFALPNNKATKLLISSGMPFKGLLNALKLYPSYTVSRKIRRNIVVSMNFLSPLIPGKFFLTIGDVSLARDVYRQISTRDHYGSQINSCAIRIGSKGKGKKVIFQFQDKMNQVISYIKVADTLQRGPGLESEMKFLEYLASTCDDLFKVPRVLGLKRNASNLALELSPLTGFGFCSSLNFNQITSMYEKLVARTGSSVPSISFAGEQKRLRQYLTDLSMVEWLTEHLMNVKNNMPVFSLSNRDMPAWNVLMNENGDIGILDWEFARFEYNPFQDLFHFVLHTRLNNTKKRPANVLKKTLSDSTFIKSIVNFAKSIGVEDTSLISSSFICYLWDWYSLEQDNADKPDQGQEYLELLTWLKQNEDSNQYFV